jgi:hypothetical protein
VEAQFVSARDLGGLPFHPNIKDELIEGLASGFAQARYLGVRWLE